MRYLPENQTILGYTEEGVPNPFVAYQAPYPSIGHGRNKWVEIRDLTYSQNPFKVPVALGQTCDSPPLFHTITGNSVLDGVTGSLVGAIWGYILAKKDDKKTVAMNAGLLTGCFSYLGGFVGFVGALALTVYLYKSKGIMSSKED